MKTRTKLDPREAALKAALQELTKTLADPVKHRRIMEIRRLKEMVPPVVTPEKIGKAAITRADKKHFALAVDVSNRVNDAGQTVKFAKAIDESIKHGDARFFEVVAAAVRHVDRMRKDGFTRASAHAMLVLAAKLHIEDNTGKEPATMDVTRLAAEVGRKWFKGAPFTIAGTSSKSTWSKARKAAGITYLEKSGRS